MCWFWRYINCLFLCLLNFLPPFLPSLLSSFLMLSFLLNYFLTCLLPDLSIYSFRIDPFRLQAAGRRKRPNLALVFWVHFMLLYILLWMRVCFCCVWFSLLVLSQEIGCEERLWNDLFCVVWDVKPQVNQSINQSRLVVIVDNKKERNHADLVLMCRLCTVMLWYSLVL